MKITWRSRRAVGGLAVLLALAGCAGVSAQTSVDSEPLPPTAIAPPADGSPSPAAPATASTGPEAFTVVANGDVLIHNSLWMEAERAGGGRMNFTPQLAGIKGRVAAADLGICHLETTMAPAGGPYGSYPVFATPPWIIDAIKATGYDGCSTVSNHTLDQGFAGVKRTLDDLDEAGLGHAGTARTAAESRQPRVYNVKGAKVAHLAYAGNFNGYSVPSSQPWCCNKLSTSKIITDAKGARANGAQVVIVSIHEGDENVARPSTTQRGIARELANSEAVDLVIGNHVHVVQPVEKIGKMWIAYGHGNLISGQYESWHRNREGVTTSFTFTRHDDGGYAISKAIGYPTFNAADPTRVVDLVSALPRTGGDSRLLEAYRSTRSTLLSLGADRDGFVVPAPGQKS